MEKKVSRVREGEGEATHYIDRPQDGRCAAREAIVHVDIVEVPADGEGGRAVEKQKRSSD